MALRDRLRGAVEALLGISTYQPPPNQSSEVDERIVEELREALGGNIQQLPTTKLRWYQKDLETAQLSADTGYLRLAAQLHRAVKLDGTCRGLFDSRTKGLIRLPKRYYGNEDVADALRARNGTRSVFDEMFPPSELELLDGDGLGLGVGVAELQPVKGRSYPVMVRLEPEFLSYRWYENRWYFTSAAGALPITPGDGRWILHVPGGRLTPWMHGLWAALGTAYIAKRHAMLYRDNYCAKLANPARLAYAPSGATEAQRFGFFRRMLGWGPNTVLELPPGWEAKLLESNGRGWEVFQKQIDTSDREFMIALAGQVITTQGGSGFDGQDVAQDIKQDLIQGDADALAYTINTQGLPQYIAAHFGEDALQSATIVEWDTGTSVDKERETRTLGQVADAIARLTSALAPYDRQVDIAEVATRFAVPTKEGAADVAVTMPVLESGEAGAGKVKAETVQNVVDAAVSDDDDDDLEGAA